MTARRSTARSRRRTAGATQIPKSIAAWFAGERPISFVGVSPPHRYALRDYWDAWKEEHPGAIPPENLEVFLREPAPGSRQAEIAAVARRKLGF
jgi:hypothetical protein